MEFPRSHLLGRELRRLLVVAVVAAATLLLAVPASANPPSALQGYKSASVSWKRVWDWTIDKRVTPTTGVICPDTQSVRVLAGETSCQATSTHHYTIELTRTARDSFTARGAVCVRNVGAGPTKGLRIEDQIQLVSGSSHVVLASRWLDLGSNPVLDPGELACYPYSIPFDGFKKGATLRNVAFIAADNAPLRRPISPPYGLPSSGGYSVVAVAPMRIPYAPTSELNKRVEVVDSALDGPISFPREGGSLTYEYDKTYSECKTFVNTATLYDAKGKILDFDEASVRITCEGDPPPPPPGDDCTLTQGFWGTHDGDPNDDVWPRNSAADFDGDGTAEGPGERWFGSSFTWGDVIDFQLADFGPGPPPPNPDRAAYRNLAQQYIAAKLNIASGAAPVNSTVSASLTFAEGIFNSATIPVSAGELGSQLANVSGHVGTLTSYNEGNQGFPHCD